MTNKQADYIVSHAINGRMEAKVIFNAHSDSWAVEFTNIEGGFIMCSALRAFVYVQSIITEVCLEELENRT